jgi:hypothetical protein
MSYDQYNPSDKRGVTRSQEVVIGVVVDNKDPTETGRVKVRILGEQEDIANIPDDKLPWYPVMTNGFAQLKGVGRFPAGGGYLPGSRIVMQNLGQQGFIIIGAITNSETTPGKEDRHPESTSTSLVAIRDGLREHRRVLDGGRQLNELEAITQAAKGLMDSERLAKWTRVGPKDKKRGINTSAGTPQYNDREPARTPEGQSPMPISVDPWDFAINAQKFVKKIPNAELIKGAADMIENLKRVAETGQNPRMPNSIGGMGNIISALQSIMSLISKFKKKKDDDDKKKEEELKKLLELNTQDNNKPVEDTPTS